jgi:LmbE family N-acetylglucosaminyl deacetylase
MNIRNNQDHPTLKVFDGVNRVLCVQPHGYINDLAAGGTLAALHDRGIEIHYLTLTDDLIRVLDPLLSADAAAALLKRQQIAAGETIGVTSHTWLELPVTGDPPFAQLCRQVVRAIRCLRPEMIFTCDPWLPYEADRDHRQTGLAVAEACLLHALPRFKTDPAIDSQYQPYVLRGVAFYLTQAPNTTISISTHRGRKVRALRCYQAQFTPQTMQSLLQRLESEERRAAQGQPFEFGETFKILRPEQLHLGTLAWKV